MAGELKLSMMIGDYEIVRALKEGVVKPKKYRSPMPPGGGVDRTPAQIKALTAYIWSLSHKASPQ